MPESPEKKIFGLIGYPVKHSLSAFMHNAAFKALGINAEYKLFEIKPEELEDFLSDLKKNNIYGLNVTIPHKITLVENKTIRTDLSGILAGVGAVNTIKREGNILHCFNTDVEGFVKSLIGDLKFNTAGKNVFILGCGGVARAIVTGLNTQGLGIKKIYMYDRNKDAIDSTKKHFDSLSNSGLLNIQMDYIRDYNQVPDKIKDVHLLVNASPVGMKDGDSSIIDKKLLHKGLSVYDVVYNRKTQLVKDAQDLGIPAVGGLGMLLYQGMLSFKIWTGKIAPKEVMLKALLEALNKQN